jgi:hypothetical protein
MAVGMEEDTRKLYYLTVGEPFTETNSKIYVEKKRYRNFVSNSFCFVFIWKEHFRPGFCLLTIKLDRTFSSGKLVKSLATLPVPLPQTLCRCQHIVLADQHTPTLPIGRYRLGAQIEFIGIVV